MKNDKYKQARGGWSRMLKITCENCKSHICFYQKDGPGPLKRMYLDRIIGTYAETPELVCKACNDVLGIRILYKKENRPAYRLFVASVKKEVIKASFIK